VKYFELKIDLNPVLPAREVLYADLNNAGVESIVDTETGVLAYIAENDYSQDMTNHFLVNNLPVEITLSQKLIEDQNWNATWEESFEPIIINDRCTIKAPFHGDAENEFDVVISPQMSFGTGHHETTFLISQELFDLDLKDKVVLDMGCGTAVLAILAEKLGAKDLDAIDIEEWAYKNALENIQLNGSVNINTFMGDVTLLGKKVYDVVLANINRNVLLNDLSEYVKVLSDNGTVLLSGFFTTDKNILVAKADELGLKFDYMKDKNGWAMLRFTKKYLIR